VYCDTAIVNITIVPVNDPPVAFNENIRLCGSIGNSTSVNILSNGDFDPDGTLLSAQTSWMSGPSHGNATISLGGMVTYTPVAGYFGTDMVVFSICDIGSPLPSACSFDTVFLTVDRAVTADAGVDQQFCQSNLNQVLLNGNNVPWANVLWTQVSGPSALIIPSNASNAAAFVNNTAGTYTFQYSVNNNTCSATDQVTYTIWNPPTQANAGPDQQLCGVTSTTIFGNVPVVGTGLWSQVTGPSVATISFPNTPTASLTNLQPGLYTFAWTISNGSYCSPSIDYITINVSAAAIGTAGPNYTICEGDSYVLSGATMQNATSVHWTTTGTGTFNNPNVLNPQYTPSVNDIHDGYVNLILTGYAASPCPNLIDTMTLFISHPATVYAGPDETICAAQTSFVLNNSTAQNAVSYFWNSSGTGLFSVNTALHPTYFPSQADRLSGSVTLTLTVNSASPCSSSSDAMVLTISRQAVVNAGPDVTICETGFYSILNSTASDFTSLLWTTSGTGTFDNPNSLHPIYTPSVNDIHDGYVILTLAGNSTSPCVTVNDYMILTIERQATIDVGPDAIICESAGSYHIVGSVATNAVTYFWNSSGTGTFVNGNTLHPTYIPSLADINAGVVTFTGSAYSTPHCVIATDVMTLSIIRQAIVNAGADATICETNTYAITTASSQYTNGLQWTSSGTGTFSANNIINPIYTPSQNDILDGYVYLTLTGTSASPCVSVSDVMKLTINHQATVNAGPDEIICETAGLYLISGSSSAFATSYSWITSGSGTFVNGNTLHPTYIPSAGDLISGSVILTVTANAASPCPSVTDAMMLTISHQAIISAGTNATICETGTYALNTSTAQNAASIQWTTSGTGTFSNANTLHPVYTPSANDIDDGQVYLILTANSVQPCVTVTDTMLLTISYQASNVFAGADAIICETQTYTLSNATADNASALLWTTSGTGTFNAANILHPTYMPSAADIAAGSVTLTLTAASASPCFAVSDAMVLSFSMQATASAGPDDVVCENSSYTIVGATATNATSYLWTTSGSGTFADATILQAVYTPSAADILNGSVTLSLHVTSENPCANAPVDAMLLTISHLPVMYAGADTSICEYSTYYVDDATASYTTSMLWTTNGLGAIHDSNTLNPTYVPAAGEIGTIMLVLNGVSSQVCGNVTISDTMYLTIMDAPVANAGIDDTISYNYFTHLNGTVSQGSGIYYTHWEPASLLVDPNIEDPVTVALTDTTIFTLTVTDLVTGCTAQDAVTIIVGPKNAKPIAVDDYDTTNYQQCTTIDVLINDYDPEGGVLTVTICNPPANGTVVINSDNTITYCPYDGYSGDDFFCYQICDNGTPIECDQATVYIHVNPIVNPEDIIIYNGVSPNGDGDNDVWIVENIEFFPDNEVTIFNRWGDVIAEYTHYNNRDIAWDAMHNGKRVPDGTYYYVLEIKNVKRYAGWIYVKTGK
jgi:gliding motility-associated-like protein